MKSALGDGAGTARRAVAGAHGGFTWMPMSGGVPAVPGSRPGDPALARSAAASERTRAAAAPAPIILPTTDHDMTTTTVLARMPRRGAWPTLTFTLIALLAVLGVLLLSGRVAGTTARFELRVDPAEISLTAGDSTPIVVTVSAEHGFDATVTLDTTALPPGVQLDLDRH